jgi:hypothetical protein
MRPQGDTALTAKQVLLVQPYDRAHAKLPREFVIRSPHSNYGRSIITEVRTSLVTSVLRHVGLKSIEQQLRCNCNWIQTEEHLERSFKWEERIKNVKEKRD